MNPPTPHISLLSQFRIFRATEAHVLQLACEMMSIFLKLWVVNPSPKDCHLFFNSRNVYSAGELCRLCRLVTILPTGIHNNMQNCIFLACTELYRNIVIFYCMCREVLKLFRVSLPPHVQTGALLHCAKLFYRTFLTFCSPLQVQSHC
jgi:hypothetical protein